MRVARKVHVGVPVAIAALFLTGCGDDGGTGPSGEVDFPTLDPAVRAEFCIRGQIVPPDSRDESIQGTDCPTVFPVGLGPGFFYETWRVRVASLTTVTMSTESNLDTFVDVFEIDPSNPMLGTENLLIFNDDGGVDLNAGFNITLQPGVEYWVMVSTLGDVGPYTLRVTE